MMHFDFGPWQIFGLAGNAAFTSRFIVQWVASERAKKSIMPISFWWLSMIGSIILLIYFVHRGDVVGVLGYVFNIVPYSRNLMLIHKAGKQANEPAVITQQVEDASDAAADK